MRISRTIRIISTASHPPARVVACEAERRHLVFIVSAGSNGSHGSIRMARMIRMVRTIRMVRMTRMIRIYLKAYNELQDI